MVMQGKAGSGALLSGDVRERGHLYAAVEGSRKRSGCAFGRGTATRG